MTLRLFKVSLLLFGSGICALVYQIVWLRELRLVFGASTAASAAVLAIFMGGLGLGGALIGKRADRHRQPLQLYAFLEILISVSAAATPFLVAFARHIYIFLGGSITMGPALSTGLRLLLSMLVLAVPSVLMGGTLPAACRATAADVDAGRRNMALLYGFNTLGAVTGAGCATFFLIEVFGLRNSLFSACLLNALIGISAQAMARRISPLAVSDEKQSQEGGRPAYEGPAMRSFIPIPPAFVYLSSGIVGFVFFLMEIVWYRMLAPLLGGSTYTFGLILCTALFGIGLGGGLYAAWGKSIHPRLTTFSLTCGIEALCMAAAYALGDRIAVVAALIHPIGALGLKGQALGWILICSVVVMPAAVAAGFQFPLLVALLGKGRRDIGRHVGLAYAWNTGGAILGSLAGGFGLLPLLTAVGCWKAVVVVLCLLAGFAMVLSLAKDRRPDFSFVAAALVCLAIGLLFAGGPSAVWRHRPIGAGLVRLTDMDRNEIRNWSNLARRSIVWETEGVESSVGIDGSNGYAFLVNGKADGNAVFDAGTQVMLGMVSALLHPEPKKALVIGLGTGSSAGWLANIDSMQRVDVVEIEPDIVQVAARCAPVNRDVLNNPKVQKIISDGREIVLTSPEKYDLIVSEPSNPYRSGIAGLYTLEFYRAVARRLADGGMFSQWVQAYDVDAQTIRTIYATLATVFPFVETWQTKPRDLLIVCSMKENTYSADVLRNRLSSEPFRSALLAAWGSTDLEGYLSHYVARTAMVRQIAEKDIKNGWLNTDDRMLVEFGFARTVGRKGHFSAADLLRLSRSNGWHRPKRVIGTVDWDLVDENFLMMHAKENMIDPVFSLFSGDRKKRAKAYIHFQTGELDLVLRAWKDQSRVPVYPLELIMVAEAMADAGLMDALPLIEALRVFRSTEADAIEARFLLRCTRMKEAGDALVRAFRRLADDPWANPLVMARTLALSVDMARKNKDLAKTLYELYSTSFSVNILNESRLRVLLEIGSQLDALHGARAVRQFEPHIPWEEEFLRYRLACYDGIQDPLRKMAGRDLERFLLDAPRRFTTFP